MSHIRPFSPTCLVILIPVFEGMTSSNETRHISDSRACAWTLTALGLVFAGWYASIVLGNVNVFDGSVGITSLYVLTMNTDGNAHSIAALFLGVCVGLSVVALTAEYLPNELIPIEFVFAPIYLAFLFNRGLMGWNLKLRRGHTVTVFALLEYVTVLFVCVVLLSIEVS